MLLPYTDCVVKFNGQVTGGAKGGGSMDQTRTIKSNLNPKWEEQFSFLLSPGAKQVRLASLLGGAVCRLYGYIITLIWSHILPG